MAVGGARMSSTAEASVAPSSDARQADLAKFADHNTARRQELRKLLWLYAPHGSTRLIAHELKCQESHVSRQFSGERRLTDDVATYALHLIKQRPGMERVVSRIYELRDLVDPDAVTRITLVLYPDGHCEWAKGRP